MPRYGMVDCEWKRSSRRVNSFCSYHPLDMAHPDWVFQTHGGLGIMIYLELDWPHYLIYQADISPME